MAARNASNGTPKRPRPAPQRHRRPKPRPSAPEPPAEPDDPDAELYEQGDIATPRRDPPYEDGI